MHANSNLKAAIDSAATIGNSGPLVEIHAPDGNVAFGYDSTTQRGWIRARNTVLNFRAAPEGLEFEAIGDFSVNTHGRFEIAASAGVRLACGREVLEMGPTGTYVSSRKIDLRTEHANMDANRVVARAATASFSWGKLEQVVGRMLVRARYCYHRVENLWHFRAGRVRNESNGDFYIKGETLRLSAQKDARLNGRTVHLG
jgi:hypothetical protein